MDTTGTRNPLTPKLRVSNTGFNFGPLPQLFRFHSLDEIFRSRDGLLTDYTSKDDLGQIKSRVESHLETMLRQLRFRQDENKYGLSIRAAAISSLVGQLKTLSTLAP